MTLQIDVVVATHRGRVRDHNEDAAGIAGWTLTAEESSIVETRIEVGSHIDLVVADGLGGHVGGEVASRTAIGAFFGATGSLDARLAAASEALHAVGDSDSRMRGLATTIAGAQVLPDGSLTVFNVGDSRVYRLVDGLLGMLTVDDTNQNGNLTQVLGGELRTVIEPHFYETDLGDDILLICSDGLITAVDEDRVSDVLALPLRRTANELLDAALLEGAPDNVTFILCARSWQ